MLTIAVFVGIGIVLLNEHFRKVKRLESYEKEKRHVSEGGWRFAKYPAVGVVVIVLRVFGWVDLIGSVCLALFVLMQDQKGDWKLVVAVAIVACGVWSAIVLFAFAELLAIQVDIERNTASRESND